MTDNDPCTVVRINGSSLPGSGDCMWMSQEKICGSLEWRLPEIRTVSESEVVEPIVRIDPALGQFFARRKPEIGFFEFLRILQLFTRVKTPDNGVIVWIKQILE